MKRFFFIIGALCISACVWSQTISFSMEEELTNQNTPEGWTAVQLPKNLPAITESNTFYITSYGASQSSSDNTAAIQAALNAVPSTGGMVVVPAGTWMFGRIQIKSKTILHLCAGATLKLLAYADQIHTSKTPYITNKPDACDIVIEGEGNTSVIEGQGGPWWDAVENKESGLQRGAIIRFENGKGSRFLFRHFRIQNAPGVNLTLGNSGRGTHNTIHHISIYAPSSHAADPSHNTDGIPIWAPYANIYNCDIDTGDDNVVTDSYAQYIHVWNCHFKAGHGASLGSYTQNMHDIIYENINFEGTDCGFRLKSNIDRSGDVYNLVFRNCTLNNVMNPIQITAWYDQLPDSPAAAAASPETFTSTTPQFHDILIQNITVSGYTTKLNNAKNGYGIFIYGRPESLVKNVTFDNVKIEHSKGMKLNFCEGIKFINGSWYSDTSTGNTSTAAGTDDVIKEKYQASYTWQGTSPDVKTITATLSGSTYQASTSNANCYNFSGGYSVTNANPKGKNYGAGNSATVKYSADEQYTITHPAGTSVKSVSFTGYSNYDAGSYLKEVNGTTYAEDLYPYIHDSNKAHFRTYTINFDQPVSDPVTFTPGGSQACFIITLVLNSTTTDIITPLPLPIVTDGTYYTIDGRKLNGKPSQKGIYITQGKKVVIK